MGYQEDCEAYAVYGNPERDHWDHEENARYDRFDGWGDPDPCLEYDLCTSCGSEGNNPDCEDCKNWAKDTAEILRAEKEAREAYNDDMDDVNSSDYVPF